MSTEQTLKQLDEFLKSGKISGSWLIYGPFGVGKRTMLRRFISKLLTGKERTDDFFHADLKWIRRDFTDEEKKVIAKNLVAGKALDADDAEKRARKSEITVDVIRSGINFLSLTSSADRWRVLVIDTADEMNSNAANALLKLLEEPPARSIIFLISHNVGRLLPTIRSRCRRLPVKTLSNVKMKSFILENYPDEENISLLLDLAQGSIGKLKNIMENDGVAIYQDFLSLLSEKCEDVNHLNSFCDAVSKSEKSFEMMEDFFLHYLLSLVKSSASDGVKNNAALDMMSEVQKQMRDIKNLYLDKKNSLMNLIYKIGRIL